MIVVIADDLTGAAELAGIACSYGLQTEMLMEVASPLLSCDVLVVATDTRSMTETEASDYIRCLAAQLKGVPVQIFKKTDSALRGHVMAELSSLLSVTDYRHVLFVPANPSRNRLIRQGVYYVDGIPISESDFSFDPEFPAYTSFMTERFPEAAEWNVAIPDVGSMEDIRVALKDLTADTLLAGAADLFETWLQSMGYTRQSILKSEVVGLDDILLVCGSTQSRTPSLITVTSMPVEVYEGIASVSLWIEQATALYKKKHALALTIPPRHLTGREVAVRLRIAMSVIVKTLVALHRPSQLVIEGGSTASCCLKAVGWHSFKVLGELSPGVVRMMAPCGTVVILKPGSYDWNGLFGF